MTKLFYAAFGALLLAGCPKPSGPSTPSARTAADAVVARAGGAIDPGRCSTSDARLRPFTVDWDATEQAELEAHASHSVVLVKVDGCSLQLLPQCNVPGVYRMVESSHHEQSLSLTSRDALYAEVPFSVASLGAHLEGNGSLDLRYFIRGLKVSSAPFLARSQLGAGCEAATHLVINYAVGAYELGGSSSTNAGAEAKGFGASAGGGTDRASKAVFRSGEIAKCSSDPRACTAPVRLRLVPILDAPPAGTTREIAALATQKPQPTPKAAAELDPNVIGSVVRSAIPSVRACLEKRYAGQRSLRFKANFTILTDGTVGPLELKSDDPLSPSFHECTTDALRSMRFPPVQTETKLSIPVSFTL